MILPIIPMDVTYNNKLEYVIYIAQTGNLDIARAMNTTFTSKIGVTIYYFSHCKVTKKTLFFIFK